MRRLNVFGTRNVVNGLDQTASRPGALFAKDQLPVAIAHRDEIAVIVEIIELVSGALVGLARQVVQLVVAVEMILEGGVTSRRAASL